MKQLIIFIGIIVLFSACEKYDEHLVLLDDQFVLEVRDTTGIKADGRSVIKIVLVKKIEVKDGMKAVFSTNKGGIQNPEIPLKDETSISLLTVDQDTGTYFIKVQIKDGAVVKLEKSLIFSLQKALPDAIAIDPDKLTYNFTTGKQTTMQVYLSRTIGLVSKGCTVNFKAYQLGLLPTDTISVGRFTGLNNNFSNADGKLQSNVVFYSESPNDIDSFKVVYIKAYTNNNQGQQVSNQIRLQYLK